MNTPNKLTLLRIVLAPVFMLLMFLEFPGNSLAALVVFIIASVTDAMDGALARKNDQITDFGKLLDPLADKMLTTAAFLTFVWLKIGTGIVWIALIVLTREFLVTSIRLLAARDGHVVAASIWGKLKTVSQMTAIIFALSIRFFAEKGLFRFLAEKGLSQWGWLDVVITALLWISAALTVISGADYLFKNIHYINHRK